MEPGLSSAFAAAIRPAGPSGLGAFRRGVNSNGDIRVTPDEVLRQRDLRLSFDAPVKVHSLANPMIREQSSCSVLLPNASEAAGAWASL
jgi:hypothetical protein